MLVALTLSCTYTPDALQQFDWFITGVIVVNIGLMAATIRNQPTWWTTVQVGSSQRHTRPCCPNSCQVTSVKQYLVNLALEVARVPIGLLSSGC